MPTQNQRQLLKKKSTKCLTLLCSAQVVTSVQVELVSENVSVSQPTFGEPVESERTDDSVEESIMHAQRLEHPSVANEVLTTSVDWDDVRTVQKLYNSNAAVRAAVDQIKAKHMTKSGRFDKVLEVIYGLSVRRYLPCVEMWTAFHTDNIDNILRDKDLNLPHAVKDVLTELSALIMVMDKNNLDSKKDADREGRGVRFPKEKRFTFGPGADNDSRMEEAWLKVQKYVSDYKLIATTCVPSISFTKNGQATMYQPIHDLGVAIGSSPTVVLPRAMVAACAGDVDTLKCALQHIDVNEKSAKGSNLIHNAVFNYKIDVVRLLLDKDADVNALQAKYQSPLQIALSLESFFSDDYYEDEDSPSRIAALLIESGADVNLAEEDYQTPLDILLNNHTFTIEDRQSVFDLMMKHGLTIEQDVVDQDVVDLIITYYQEEAKAKKEAEAKAQQEAEAKAKKEDEAKAQQEAAERKGYHVDLINTYYQENGLTMEQHVVDFINTYYQETYGPYGP